MATRLDRLVALLENGTTAAVRRQAAAQLGAAAAAHGDDALRLLARAAPLLRHRAQEARHAGAWALEAVVAAARTWPPSDAPIADAEAADRAGDGAGPPGGWPLSHLSAQELLALPPLLAASASAFAHAGAAPSLQEQRAQVERELGVENAYAGVDLVGDKDLVDQTAGNAGPPSQSGPPQPGKGPKLKLRMPSPGAPAVQAPKTAEPQTPSTEGLSVRQQLMARKKAKMEVTKLGLPDRWADGTGSRAVPVSIPRLPSRAGNGPLSPLPTPATPTVPAAPPLPMEPYDPSSYATHPLLPLLAHFTALLGNPRWESRHGACLGIRAVLTRGASLGFEFPQAGDGEPDFARGDPRANALRHAAYCEHLASELLQLLAADRFADFGGSAAAPPSFPDAAAASGGSGGVAAPVREACAGALATLCSAKAGAAPAGVARRIVGHLVALLRGASGQGAWHPKHAALLGLRYILGHSRSDLISEDAIAAVLAALGDADDEVRGAAAAVLVPLVRSATDGRSGVLALLGTPDQIDARLVRPLWAALAQADDLSGSTAPIVDLLSLLLPLLPPPKTDLLPRLAPFLRHSSSPVRLSVARCCAALLRSLAPSDPARLFRLLFQSLLLESNRAVLDATWDCISLLCPPCASLAWASQPALLSAAHTLLMTPPGTPLDASLFLAPADRTEAVPMHDRPALLSDAVVLDQRTVEASRWAAARAAGALAACSDSADAHSAALSRFLEGGVGYQRSCAAWAAGEWFARLPPGAGPAAQADALAGELAARVLFVEQLAWLEALRRTCLALVRELEAAGAGRLEVPALPPAGQFDEGWVQGTLWPLAGKFAGGTGVHAALAAAEAELARYSDRSECLQARVAGAAACAVVASGRLPEKVTAVVRAVVSSVKIEASEGLQRASARAAAGLVALLKPEAADKMVRNFGAFLCSDPRGCPPVSEAAHGVLTLARWTKDGAEDAKKANAGARAIEAAKKEEAKEPPSKKQKRAGGKAAAVPGQAEAEAAAALVQAESAEEVHLARSAVTSRGGEMALSEICALYGADVADRVPRVWEIVSAGLEGFAAQGEQLRAAHAQLASDDTFSQTVVNSVFALGKLVGHFSGAALERALALLPAVSRLLATPRPAVRFACSECLAMFAEHATVRTLLHVISDVLPLLGDTTSDVARQAGAEAVYHIVDRMQLKVLPYLIFLVIPVLKRISDPEPGVRFLCTHNFATLVKLMPLEQGAPDPEGLDPELIRQKKEERRFIGQLIGTEQVEDFEIPAGIIKAELRRYQQEGVNWLGFLGRYGMHGILCDDMGLGKTLQTISIVASNHYLRAQRFKETGAADSKPIPTLVVCPTTIVGHWFYEIRNFTEVLNPIMYAGQPAVRAKLRPKLLQHDVVITSYECLRNDLQELGKITWNYVVLDEGHLIRNAKTKITQAVKSLISTHRLILSGTPIQNNALELWSLFDFLMPGFLGTEKQFNEKYSKPILASRDAKASTKEQEAGTLALDALHRQVLPFLLRRMKEDVLQDLPPKIIQDYYSDLSEIQRTLYEDFSRSRAKNEVYEDVSGKGGKGSGGTHVFQALQYLRKLVNHPALVLTPQHPEHGKVTSMLAKSNSSLRDLQHAPKLLALQELLLDCGIGTGGATPAGEDASNLAVAGHRALIFCQLKPMLDIIENDLFKAHMPDVTYMRLDGSVDATKRQELVRKFNDDPGIDVLLLTTHVGGLGLNLTGADTVIFVEHDWNPMKDLQAMDRAHRIGQKRKVNVYRLITRNTLEEKIMGLQRFKLNIASSIVNEENVGLKSMLSDSEQLLDLFNIGEAKEPAKKDGDAKMTQKEILESMDKWDDEQRFEEQYETADFLATLR
ncbi:SNF2 family N-terminal domain-containing protein [Hyaloraphidium curvatum]|nr:SNF2 family N-terminal domain-containing protein [Hyaloraphidium curvatum]